MALADGRLIPHGKQAAFTPQGYHCDGSAPPLELLESNGYHHTWRKNTSERASSRKNTGSAMRRRTS
eukprot:11075116-Heterocapsa_arctica.AAC.1